MVASLLTTMYTAAASHRMNGVMPTPKWPVFTVHCAATAQERYAKAAAKYR